MYSRLIWSVAQFIVLTINYTCPSSFQYIHTLWYKSIAHYIVAWITIYRSVRDIEFTQYTLILVSIKIYFTTLSNISQQFKYEDPILLTMLFACVFFVSLTNPTTFHHLMVILFLVDCFYLFLTILKRIKTVFKTNLIILTMIYPTFIYPMSSISLTMSIFLTVAMAHERYIVIKNPLSHQRHMRSSKYRRNMLLKYLLFMVICSVGFNFSKFFEAYIVWEDSSMGATKGIR